MGDDGRLDLARGMPIEDVAAALGIDWLRSVTATEWAGACPVCGGFKKREADRFSINPSRGVFLCRKCQESGDGLALVQFVRGCDFRAALAFLAGDPEAALDPAEIERRRRKAAEAERKRQAEIERLRAWAIRDARKIWQRAAEHDVSLARVYLEGRGIEFSRWPPTLRLLPDHPYRRRVGGASVEMHRGPAMIAAIQGPTGRVTAVHQTWIDPDRPGQKATICDGDGVVQPSKLVRGSKKGGAIRLTPAPGPDGVLIMGEGIETTASAMIAARGMGAAFWCGVDLGNMAGRQVKLAGQRHSGRPDLSDAEAFVPPPGLAKLVFLQDGDSDPKATRAKLEAGLRRAQHFNPALVVQIAAAPEGKDFNDLARGGPDGPAEDD